MSTAIAIDIQELGGSPRTVRCERGKVLIIGRDPACDVILGDLSVSRRHTAIEVFDIGWSVTDTSANGTYIGDERLLHSARTLNGSAELRLGSVKLVVQPADMPVVLPESTPRFAHRNHDCAFGSTAYRPYNYAVAEDGDR